MRKVILLLFLITLINFSFASTNSVTFWLKQIDAHVLDFVGVVPQQNNTQQTNTLAVVLPQYSNPGNELEMKIHELINVQRIANGLGKLLWDPELSSIARQHSQDMINMSYFSHISPGGGTFSDRYKQSNYSCAVLATNGYTYYGAENIFYTTANYSTDSVAQQTVSSWMNSAGHKDNILTGLWTREGIGTAIASNDTVYVTQNFC